jgi:hypothetical protein
MMADIVITWACRSHPDLPFKDLQQGNLLVCPECGDAENIMCKKETYTNDWRNPYSVTWHEEQQ